MTNITPNDLNKMFADPASGRVPNKTCGQFLDNMRAIVCNDGFMMSVQASKYHYCLPRDNNGPYTEVEVGFPSQEEPLLGETADQDVWGYVSVETVCKIINKHGGFKEFNTGGSNISLHKKEKTTSPDIPEWMAYVLRDCPVVDGYWCPPENKNHLENVFMVDIADAAYCLNKIKINNGWILGCINEKKPVSIRMDSVLAFSIQTV